MNSYIQTYFNPDKLAKAWEVMVAGSPLRQVPVVRMTKPVMEITMMVSTKVWVMEARPWRTGWEVVATAAGTTAIPLHLTGDRERIRTLSMKHAIHAVLRAAEGSPEQEGKQP